MASEVKDENNTTPSDVKNDESIDETKNADNEIKDGVKDTVQNENKQDLRKDVSEDEEEEDDDEDEDDEVALLDRPVEVTGCRARKKVERLEMSFSTPKEKPEFPEGKGKKLGDIPRIEAQIQKMKGVDLKPLHRMLFNRTGSVIAIKRNIRRFSGFSFEKDSLDFNRKKISVEKLTISVLKQVCLILDLERGGTKEDIVNRILSFLLNPEDSKKKVPAKKKIPKDKKKTAPKKVKSEKKLKADKDESGEEHEESNEEDDSTCGEASMGGTDEEAEGLLEPKKKSKETKNFKTKSKPEKSKKGEKKSKTTKRKHDGDDEEEEEEEENDNSSGSSEDEPPAKKSKMPSDDEISKLVKQILESADLQEITMKKVIKQVSDAYPEFDLSHKRAFIKSTIKSVIS